jgi:hypothetical protein
MLAVVLVAAVQVQQVSAPFKTHHPVTVALELPQALQAQASFALVAAVVAHGILAAVQVELVVEALAVAQVAQVLMEP